MYQTLNPDMADAHYNNEVLVLDWHVCPHGSLMDDYNKHTDTPCATSTCRTSNFLEVFKFGIKLFGQISVAMARSRSICHLRSAM